MRAVRAGRMAMAAWATVATSGCLAWKVESATPREVLARPNLSAVRIVSNDSAATKLEIYDPTLVGDSISGHPSKLAVARVYVPLSHVKTIATQHKSIGKTALIVLGAAGAVGVYALLQELNQQGY
ncbi:MAG TPA: hypothetical protein VL241_02770 [Gemmatimonadales bacterium]|nr:hypothetical protein [Gemmatimonadales bacterium]